MHKDKAMEGHTNTLIKMWPLNPKQRVGQWGNGQIISIVKSEIAFEMSLAWK